MVESAVTDIVACAVTADDPLAACRQEVLVGEELLADVAAACLHERNELVGNLAGNLCILAVLEPLGEESLHLVRAAAAAEALLHKAGNGVACAVGTELHTETELAEVLEEGVGPCRTVTLCVGAIWRCREGCSVDGRTAGSVGNHHVVTEELGDCLDVRGLAATCAGAGELEERLCELGVLYVRALGNDILLVAHLAVEVVEVGLLGNLGVVRNHLDGFLLGQADIHAVAATGTVGRGHLDGELVVLENGLALLLLD